MKDIASRKGMKMNSSTIMIRQTSANTAKRSRIFYKVPRVVPNQKERFYKEDIFRFHAKYIEVYLGSIIQFLHTKDKLKTLFLKRCCYNLTYGTLISGKVHFIQRSAN